MSDMENNSAGLFSLDDIIKTEIVDIKYENMGYDDDKVGLIDQKNLLMSVVENNLKSECIDIKYEDVEYENVTNIVPGGNIQEKKKHALQQDMVELTETSEYISDFSYSDYVESSEEEEESSDDLSFKDSQNEIFVQRTRNEGEKRSFDKLQCCIYCLKVDKKNTLFTNWRKHIISIHKNEPEVCEVLSLPLNSVERKWKLEKLRNIGNFAHNNQVLRNGKGTIIPANRPSNYHPYYIYVPCRYCYGFYLRSYLWHHKKSCHFKPDNELKIKIRFYEVMLLPASSSVSTAFQQHVLNGMKPDEVFIIVRDDPLILRFGEKLYQRKENDSSHQFVIHSLRLAGAFLRQVRMLSPCLTVLLDVLDPHNGKIIIDTVHNLAEFDSTTLKFKTPSTALKLEHILNKCSVIKEAIALEKADAEMKESANNFARWMAINYIDDISKHALRNLNENKLNSPILLPVTKGIKTKQTSLKKKLEEKESS